jgi:hypothetical protein
MSNEIDLRKIEKRAWITFYAQDGLHDILFGIMIFIWAVYILVDILWLTLGIFGCVLVIPLGKRYITAPRIGRVKFDPKRTKGRIILTAGTVVVIVISFLIFFLIVRSEDYPKIMVSFINVALVMMVFGLAAYYLDNFRDFIYGIFIAPHEFVWVLFGRTIAAYYYLFLGSTILFIGFFILLRFLQRYPKPNEEVANGL